MDGIHSRKGKAILSYLLFYHKKQVNRDVLMERFWPNVSPESARNSLNVAVHSIRKAIPGSRISEKLILFKDDCYFINPEIEVVSDVSQFKDLWYQARIYEQQDDISKAMHAYKAALKLYKGDIMEEDLYSEWADAERENLREIFLLILDKISDYLCMNKQFKRAVEYCKILLSIDNCREDVHRRLMNCYFYMGKRGQAIRQYYKCKKVLSQELEVEPSARTSDLFNKIRNEDLSRII